MNLLEARATLIDLVQPGLTPALSTEELDAILARVAEVDADGYAPSEAAYTPTYSRTALYQAAVAALQLKQAKVLHTALDFSGDAGSYSAQQLMSNLSSLIREYQRYCLGAVQTRPAPGAVVDPRVNWNDPHAEVGYAQSVD